jgi:hypothetical protein
MLPNPEGTGSYLQPARRLRAGLFVEVNPAQKIPVIGAELRQRPAHLAPGFLTHQGVERAGPGGPWVHPRHQSQRLFFPSPGTVVMQAEMGRGLEDERSQGVEFFDPTLAQRLGHAAEDLLGEILGQGRIAEPAGAEHAEPLPVLLGEVPFEVLVCLLGLGHWRPDGSERGISVPVSRAASRWKPWGRERRQDSIPDNPDPNPGHQPS